jgi:phosphate starvation-inducible PhoH-like protein
MAQQRAKPKTIRAVTKFDSAKKSISILPKTDKQEEYIKAILGKDTQIVCFGPSGTGKTYVVSSLAASLYNEKKIKKIIITRPHVEVGGEKIGFLKGDFRDKTEPWALPVLDVLEEHLGKGVVDTGIKNGNIEIAPVGMMRGRSFKETFIICDEAQNLTLSQLKMLLTRVGEDSKIIVSGDIMQSDLKVTDGLTTILGMVKKYGLPVPLIEFGVEDIVRSAFTRMWVEVFIKEKV